MKHKRKKLKKKASPEAQFMLVDIGAEYSHTMKSLAGTMEQRSTSIIDGFATMMQGENLQYHQTTPLYPVYKTTTIATHFQFINHNESQVEDGF